MVPHQDSTFLHTSPLTTLGFWVPLEACSKQNGCLWVVPGSHHSGLATRWVRSTTGMRFTGTAANLPPDSYIPVEIDAGTLVLIHGELVHRSDENRAAVSRHAYTWHVINSNAEYDELNWLQPTAQLPFPPL